MRRITKRRLSGLLCAVLMLVTSIDVAAFAAGSDASKERLTYGIWVQYRKQIIVNIIIILLFLIGIVVPMYPRLENLLLERQHLVILLLII